jgi:uncharacterized protein
MDQRISAVTLGVADLARSLRFYRDGLGWEPALCTDEIVFFQMPGLVFALYPRPALAADAGLPESAMGVGGIALAYNVRSREEVDAFLSRAASAGARRLSPAQDKVWGGYSGYFADPDGHPWDVAWNPHWPIGPDGGVTFGP